MGTPHISVLGMYKKKIKLTSYIIINKRINKRDIDAWIIQLLGTVSSVQR